MNTTTVHVGGGTVQLTPDEMYALASMQESKGFEVLLTVMHGMQAGARAELEALDTPLDRVRGLQGRLSVATDLYEILRGGVVEWVKDAMSKEQTV